MVTTRTESRMMIQNGSTFITVMVSIKSTYLLFYTFIPCAGREWHFRFRAEGVPGSEAL